MMDPHTAVAYSVSVQKSTKDIPLVVLSTAHPHKFPLTPFQTSEEAKLTKPGPHKQLTELMKKDPIRKGAKLVTEVAVMIDDL